jgi:hypothetical protein
MSYFLPFVFNTIRKRTIDPTNTRFFLPKVLEDADGSNSKGKLLPVEQDKWSVGSITGDGGALVTSSFLDNWATYLEKVKKVDMSYQYPIADPSTPYPTLMLGGKEKVVIDGLENIFVSPNPVFTSVLEGYQVEATLQLGYWDGADGRVNYPSLSLNGPYRMEQKLVMGDKATGTPNGHGSTDVDGGGNVEIELEKAFIDAVFTVSVKTSGQGVRQLAVNLQSLHFRGPDADTQPSLNIVNLTIDASVSEYLRGVWQKAATDAIQSQDGRTGIFQNINAALNQPGNLGPLSNELSGKLVTVIDGLLGPADQTMKAVQPPSTLNPVDRYMFDRVRFGLNSTGSALFLPQLLCQNQNPSLSPLHIDSIDLPTISAGPITLESGKVTDLNFTGLTNAQAPPGAIAISDQEVLQFTGTLGAWNPPPKVSCAGGIPAPPARGNATFNVTPKGFPKTLTGALAMTVNGMQVTGSAKASGPDDSSLTIEIMSLALTASDLVSALKLSLDIQSDFKAIINNVINTPNVLSKVLDELNAELSRRLPEISTQVTSYAREAVTSGLK